MVSANARISFDDALAQLKPLDASLGLTANWMPIFLLFLGIVLVFAVLYWGLSRPDRRLVFRRQPKPVLHPRVTASEAIDALLEEGLLASSQSQDYYMRLRMIVRDYLSAVFRMPLKDLTTPECVAKLRGRVSTTEAEMLRVFLEQCDSFVFAARTAEQGVHDQSIDMARRIVTDIGMDAYDI